MMRFKLYSTTALLSVALAMPTTLPAQQGNQKSAEEVEELLKEKQSDAEKALPDQAADAARAAQDKSRETAEEATDTAQDAPLAEEPAPEDSAADTGAEETPQAEAEAEPQQAAPAEAPAPEPEPQQAAEPETPEPATEPEVQQAEEQAPEPAEQAEEQTPEPEPQAAPQAAENAAPAAAPQASQDAATAETSQPQADAQANPNAEAEAEAPADVEAQTEAEAGAEPAQAGDAEQLEQAAEATEPAATEAMTESQDANVETAEQAQPATQQGEELPEEDTEAQLEAQQAQAEAAAAASAGAEAAAASDGETEVVETQETTITESEARSSSEEFATGVNETQQAAPAQQTQPRVEDDDDNRLLRTLGTAAALGLGAYAIGQVLDGGGQVVSNSGDRVVVEQDGRYRVIKDDDTLLRRPGSQVRTQTFSDGSTRTVVTTDDGGQTVTIRAADGRVLRRERILPNGQSVVLFDDTQSFERVDVRQLSETRARDYEYTNASEDELRAALLAAQQAETDRTYSLNQIRYIDAVRHQVPVIALDAITFETGSSVIRPAQAEALAALGNTMREAIDRDPGQVFLIEGHTDTVGPAPYNLALSDRRAESVALALTEYFDVSPANMIVQGYGESDLKVRQAGDIRANRRAAVRNITPLLGRGNS